MQSDSRNEKTSRRPIAAALLLIALAVFAYACSFSHTVADSAMTIACVAVAVAVVCLGRPLRGFWQRLIKSDNRILTTVIHFVAGFILLGSIVLLVNDLPTDYSSLPETDAVVSERHVEVRHKKERVGRHRYRDGKAYNVYVIKGQTADGTEVELEVGRKFYNTHREGDTISLRMGPGTLGLTVYKLI